MKNKTFYDDSKVEKVPFELESFLKEKAEQFFEKVLRDNLNDKTIYTDESIVLTDRYIRECARKQSEELRNFIVILIGAYIGHYIISKFKGNWVIDKADKSPFPLNCFIKYSQNYDLYFRPFNCAINRIMGGKKESIMSEIDIIKREISYNKNWLKNLNRKTLKKKSKVK